MQELQPPQFNSSSESSEDECVVGDSLLGFDDPWSLGGELTEKMDMSDLWVTEDTVPLTDTKKSKRYSFSRQK